MKIVTSKEMAELEGRAYKQGFQEEDFMEEAGQGIARAIEQFCSMHDLNQEALLLCGKGNNAGDAYVAGTALLSRGWRVHAIHVPAIDTCSPLCQTNYHRYLTAGGTAEQYQPKKTIAFPTDGLLVDALFGTGFQGVARDPYGSLITAANQSGLPIIAVDIPSGLNGESGAVEGPAIHAEMTVFLGLPKTGFFVGEGWNHVGQLHYVDFGLPQQEVTKQKAAMELLTHEQVAALLPPIQRNRHKYQAGYVLAVAGSPTMPGAAILSSFSALKSGAGIVRLYHPEGMEIQLAASPIELIKVPFAYSDLSPILEQQQRASALIIGPGIGLTDQARELLKNLLPKVDKPCVIDADALTIIAQENLKLPPQTILTPHVGEMRRLLHDDAHGSVTPEFLSHCRTYAEKHNITLVLKGGPSFIFTPGHPIAVSTAGDPGMATAGSGDVLTGILAALLAQGCPPHEAACLGVFLHGLAGEAAAERLTSYCMTATDILKALPEVFGGL